MAKRGIFDFDSLTPGLKKLLPKVDAGVDLAFDIMEAQAGSYARENARWTDRTGNARAGLKAKHVGTPMVEHELIIYHSMPYGIWLEVRWSGRYAIIGPTMFHIAPLLAIAITESINRAVRL